MIDLTKHHIFDGGMGTMLQARGLEAGHIPELLNLTDPDIVAAIHADYADAGADILTANTFGPGASRFCGAGCGAAGCASGSSGRAVL